METGDIKWQWTGDSPAYASPIIATIQDVEQVITFSKENIIGVDFSTGKLLWEIPFTTSYSQNIVTPLLVENDLILSGLENGVILFDDLILVF